MSETTPQSQRVLVIGWDGGSWRVFRPLAENGLMPRLKSLMDRGAFGVMTSTIPPVTPPAWTTLMTGTNPERHGILGFMEGLFFGETRRELIEQSRPVSSLSFRESNVLDLLGKAGKRVMCVNLPMSYPPRPVNGIMITGMLTPTDAENFTWPHELKGELADYVIDIAHAPTAEEIAEKRSQFDLPTWVKRCTEIVAERANTVCRLGREYPWDFGFVVFTGTDRIFHPLWLEIMAFVGKGSPTTEMEGLLRDFFVALDDALGVLLDAFPDAVVMVTSDHGFGARADRTVFPDVWLEEKGFQVRRTGGASRSVRGTVRRFVRRAMEVFLPARLARRLLRKAADRQTRLLESLDRERSVAYFGGLDAASYGVVRLLEEVRSRLDEEQRSELINEIMVALEGMRGPETGEPILADVCRGEEVFPDAEVMMQPGTVFDGEHGPLPEIVLEFREGYTGRTDPLATELVGPAPSDSYVGVHRIEGMFVLAGRAFKADGEVPPLKLADVAPTVLYLSGLPVPTNMQGEVPLGLFTQEHVRTHPLRTEEPAAPEPETETRPGEPYTPEQQQRVMDRLRYLGYLE